MKANNLSSTISRAAQAWLAVFSVCATGCAECDEGECQDVVLITLVNEQWDAGDYRVVLTFGGESVECQGILPAPPGHEFSCNAAHVTLFGAGQVAKDNFRLVVIRDATPPVIEMQWELDGEEILDVRIAPNYRKLTREEYPVSCGRPCEKGTRDVVFD